MFELRAISDHNAIDRGLSDVLQISLIKSIRCDDSAESKCYLVNAKMWYTLSMFNESFFDV